MNPLQRGLAVVGLLVLLGAAAWLVSTRRHQPNSVNPTTPTASVVLDQARQQDIWRAEHTTFEIERRFGPAFLEALNSRDTDRLAGLATPQLKAFGLGAAAVTERRHGDIVELSRTRDPNEPPDSLTAIGLAETLVRIHSGFSTPARSALRVLQITEDPNRTDGWTARVLLTSIGTTAEGHKRQVLSEHTITGIVHDGKQLGQAAWLDGWTVQRTAQRHGPPALFREVTASWGLDRLPIPDNWNLEPSAVKQNRFQYAVADFNHDGRLDVAVAALGVPPLLLAGDPADGFRGVAAQVGLVQGTRRDQLSNTAVAWIDFDNDGWPDLLLGERLYRNQDGRTFVDVTGPSGLGFLPECMGCLVADYDADGDGHDSDAYAGDDCDDSDANSTIVATDADCDGTLTADDCDDSDANSTTVATDADCDTVLTADDCDDTDASLLALAPILTALLPLVRAWPLAALPAVTAFSSTRFKKRLTTLNSTSASRSDRRTSRSAS